ncbi:MAG TPA: xanthine dehydrogenase family protein molybdopterin-binding subunit [Chloroflexia bacterium]|nr:xanthine dehydrogenase family protein molybdopterin-binding subunit [Chloroflexia bacterium]
MTETVLPAGLERRREDYRVITGASGFVDDLQPEAGRPTALYMAVVRSPYAHAEIKAINLEAARSAPGVIGAYSAEELVGGMRALDIFPLPGLKKPLRKPLAVGKARYVGDPVAVVVAESRYAATDARDLVEVEYGPLPAVADPEEALRPGAPVLYPEFEDNKAYLFELGGGDIEAAFKAADRVVRLRVVNQRLAPSSLEPRACMFDYNPATGEMLARVSSQAVFRVRDSLSAFLGIEKTKIRVINSDVGGGFGAKTTFVGEEIVAASLAYRLGRPVKWLEGRSENLQAQTQGRGQINYIEAAVKNDGRVLGLKVRTVADLGGFILGVSPTIATTTVRMLNGPYRIEALDTQVVGALNNKAPTSAYRGAGRPEAAYILERTIDRVAHELQLDPADVRRRNFLPADVFPFKALTGLQYDSGNYQAALEKVLELGDYAGWRERQKEQRQQKSSKLLGLGLSTYIEIAGGGGVRMPGVPQEAATVRIRRDGTILVQSGVASNGQGHFTAFAQVAAQIFNLPGDKIEVQMNDSALPAYGFGTFGSRTTPVAASAVHIAAEAAREKAFGLAARLLEASQSDLILEEGKVMVRGVPARAVELGELARMVEEEPDLIEREEPNPVNGAPIEGLAAWRDFLPSDATFPSGAHLAVVELDTDTGDVHVLKYVAIDDCGRVLNHYLADAQFHGGLAQGLGQALYEEVAYDENGQLLSGTLMDYTIPTAEQLPHFDCAAVETPSPTNPLGAKGAGEAGCTGGPPAIVNAVLDALAPLGIKYLDMPLRPEKIWSLVQAAKAGQLDQPEPQVPPFFKGKDSEGSDEKSGSFVFE